MPVTLHSGYRQSDEWTAQSTRGWGCVCCGHEDALKRAYGERLTGNRRYALNPPPHWPRSGVPWAAPSQSLSAAGIETQAHPWGAWCFSIRSFGSPCPGWNSLLYTLSSLAPSQGPATAESGHWLLASSTLTHFFSHNVCLLNVLRMELTTQY